MFLRKTLQFKNILGLTLPKALTKQIGLEHQDYVEVYLANADTIVIKKHHMEKNQLTESSGLLPEQI